MAQGPGQDDVNVKFGADTSDLDRAGKEVGGLGQKVQASLSTADRAFVTFGQTIADVLKDMAKYVAQIVPELSKMTYETEQLGQRMGTTVGEASVLSVALGDIYSDTQTYASALGFLSRQLRNNEKDLREMGLQTRDSKGQLRESTEVMMSALALYKQFKPGLDQAGAAQQLFGRNVEAANKLMKLTPEVMENARAKAQAYGLGISELGRIMNTEFMAAQNDMNDSFAAIRKVVGEALMPVLTMFSKWLTATPETVNMLRTGLTYLAQAFVGLSFVIKTVGTVFMTIIKTMLLGLGMIGSVAIKILTGDFKGAWEDAAGGAKVLTTVWGEAGDEITKSVGDAAKAIEQLRAQDGAAGTLSGQGAVGGTRNMKPKKDKDAVAAQFATLQEQLSNWGANYEERYKIAEQFYRDMIRLYGMDSAEARRARGMMLAEARQFAQDMKELNQIGLESRKATALQEVEIARQKIQQDLDLQRISNAEAIELYRQLEEKKYAIQKQALEERKAILASDKTTSPVAVAQAQAEIEELERQHQLKMNDIQREAVNERNKYVIEGWNALRSTTEGLFKDIMSGTKSAKQILLDFFRSIEQAMSNLVAKKLAEQIFGGGPTGGAGGGGGGIMGAVGSILGAVFGGGMPGKQFGGSVFPGQPVIVGERGPEVFSPFTAGTITPNGGGGGGTVVNNNFVMQGQPDRRSQEQVAAAAGTGVNRAVRRLG